MKLNKLKFLKICVWWKQFSFYVKLNCIIEEVCDPRRR